MADKMKLYWYPRWRSDRNIWLIKEMGVEDDFELIKFKPNTDPVADAAFRKDVHPNGTIPALVVPGEAPLLESVAICMYLADRYKKFVPDQEHRSDYYNLIIYVGVTVDECLDFFFYLWFLNADYSEEKQEKMRTKFNTCMEYLARRLEGKEYLCGTFTPADCILGNSLFSAASERYKDGELLKPHPKIREYSARLQARPAFQATINME